MRALIFLAAGLLTAAAGPAAGAAARVPEAAPAPDPRWLPWLGCWEPVGPGAEGAAAPVLVCVSQEGEASGVKIVTVVDGQTASTKVLVADGERRPIERDDCRGWESARWSADGKRVFIRSELECDDLRRASSGVMAILPRSEWLEVEVVAAGGEQATRVVRYRPADVARVKAAGAGIQGVEASTAVETARVAAAGALSVEDVLEAVQQVGPDAVEPLILQRGNAFDLDSKALIEMADAGVPGKITDLMIALTYPDEFAINSITGTPSPRPAEPYDDWEDEDDLPRPTPIYGGYDRLDPGDLWRWDYRYRRWLYPYGYYVDGSYSSPYGWWYRSDRPTIIVVPRPSDTDKTNGQSDGKVVNGRGYTRSRSSSSDGSTTRRAVPRSREAPATTSAPAIRASGSDSGRSATSSRASSSSSSSSSTGRKARPRTESGSN